MELGGNKKIYNFAPSKTEIMAKKKDTTEENLMAVEEALSKSEIFIEKNQKYILIVLGFVVVVVLGFLGYHKFVRVPKNQAAANEIFMAQRYFEMDSLSLALNGDGNHLGFLDIIDEYSGTKSAKLSNYYAGICYLKQGDYKTAVDYLKNFSSSDVLVGPMGLGAIGDAYMQLGDVSRAASYYLDAANQDDNEFTTPLFLMKAGWAFEKDGAYTKALNVYQRIKKDYSRSNEGREIDKYISNMEAKKI